MLASGVPPRRWILFWTIALGGAAFDLAAKAYVFGRFALHSRHPVIDGIIEIQPSRNTGALWGLGSTWPHSGTIFAVLSIGAAAAIWYYLFVRGAARDLGITIALGLIMAGALGNCYDRLTLGYVRDFAYFHVDSINFRFAIFNFADNMLVIGALALMLLALRPDHGVETATTPSEPMPTDFTSSSPDPASPVSDAAAPQTS
jgi:signal peptidase II